MQIPFSPPDINEADIQAVNEVLRSGWITSGPVGEKFRNALTDYCQSQDTILLNSATAGLVLALHLLGIGPGDEVIVPAYTYSASASVITHTGAKIVMVDVAPDSFFVASTTWQKAITTRTKAIIAVDLGGVMVDTKPIYQAIADSQSLYKPANEVQEKIGRIALIVDGAHSLGAYQDSHKAGSIGDLTAFSFHAVKNLTTAEGGALTWRKGLPLDSDYIAKQIRLFSLHGQSKSALEKTNSAAWEYDIVFPGYKMNMADIMAALGYSQLQRYDQLIARRQTIISTYNQAFADLSCTWLEHCGSNWRSSGHLYLLRINNFNEVQRNKFIDDMYAKGISCNVHYKPIPMFTAYQNLGFSIADFPHAYAQYQNEVSLPLHTCLTDSQVQYVCDTVTNLLNKK